MDYSQNPLAFRQLLAAKLQQEHALFPPGWQRSTTPQQRLNIIQRIAAELRAIRAELPEYEAYKVAFSFEQRAFHEASQAAIYAQTCQRKLQEIAHARQQQVRLATNMRAQNLPQQMPRYPPVDQTRLPMMGVSREQVSARAGEIFHKLSDKQKHELTLRANGLPEHTKSGLQSQGINPLVFILRQIALQQIQAERNRPDQRILAQQQEALRRQQQGQMVVPAPNMIPHAANQIWPANVSQGALPNLNKPMDDDVARQQLLARFRSKVQATATNRNFTSPTTASTMNGNASNAHDALPLPDKLRRTIQPSLPPDVQSWAQFKQHMVARNPAMGAQILHRIQERQIQLYGAPKRTSPLEISLMRKAFGDQLPANASNEELEGILARRSDVRAKVQELVARNNAPPIPASETKPAPPSDSKAEMNNNIRQVQSMLKEMQPAAESRTRLQLDEKTRGIMVQKIKDAQPWIGKMVLMMALMVRDTRCQPMIREMGQMSQLAVTQGRALLNIERSGSILTQLCLFGAQHVKTGNTEEKFTLTLSELDKIIQTLKSKMDDFQARMQKRKSETAAARNNREDVPPAAPTSEIGPSPFGRHSPQGTATFYGKNELTQDKLVLPPRKRRKASIPLEKPEDERIDDPLAFCLDSLRFALNLEAKSCHMGEYRSVVSSKENSAHTWVNSFVTHEWLTSVFSSLRHIAVEKEPNKTISPEMVLGLEGEGGTRVVGGATCIR